jgi:hypothetical protein
MTDTYRALCAELVDIVTAHCNPDDYAVGYCAAVLTRARAELAKPEPVAPSDEEIIAFWSEHCAGDGDAGILRLARLGTPAIQPVPVSERLPGPEDCDSERRCWWWNVTMDPDSPNWWSLESIEYIETEPYWLPHHALPMPAPANNTRGENLDG